jgi:hypothetical protein
VGKDCRACQHLKESAFMSASDLIHLPADLSHYHTDYLWKMPGSWEGYPYYSKGYPYYSSPEFYEDIALMAAWVRMAASSIVHSAAEPLVWRQMISDLPHR